MVVMEVLAIVLLLVGVLWAGLRAHLPRLVRELRAQQEETARSSPTSARVEAVEPVEWVSMAPEELPVTLLQAEDVVRITLVTRPSMAQAILQELTPVVDPKTLYLEVQVGLRPPH
jgi:hypothetical protein